MSQITDENWKNANKFYAVEEVCPSGVNNAAGVHYRFHIWPDWKLYMYVWVERLHFNFFMKEIHPLLQKVKNHAELERLGIENTGNRDGKLDFKYNLDAKYRPKARREAPVPPRSQHGLDIDSLRSELVSVKEDLKSQ